MDCHKVLMLLTKFDDEKEVTDDKLKEILDAALADIPEDVLNTTVDHDDVGWKYLKLLLHTIVHLVETELSVENPLLTVTQFRILKTSFESAASIGIVPALPLKIKVHMTSIRSKIFKLNLDNSILETHKRLIHTAKIFLQCFEQVILRPVLIPQLDCLLAALLQISHAPLAKPVDVNNTVPSSSDFVMTTELYDTLKEEQDYFHQKIQEFMENCPQSMLIKELMVILGVKDNPRWLQINIRHYLTNRIMQPNGIGAITAAICDEVIDVGKCWDKLDLTARLIAASHGKDAGTYYNSVCSQIIKLLNSKNNKQATIMAKWYMKALYDYNPYVCIEKIMHNIMEPFLIKGNTATNQSNVLKTEEEVSECIENLCKLYITSDVDFKCLPTNLLTPVVLPLFYLYAKIHESIYVHRDRVRQLLLKILVNNATSTETIFSVFLDHQVYQKEFGEKLNFRFGDNGGIEIISEDVSSNYEELANCLFDLVSKDGSLSFKLFTHLLNELPKINGVTQNVQKGKLLETSEDLFERIEKQLTAIKLLTLLSSSTLVQEAIIKDPEPLLEFIKFYFSKVTSSSESEESHEQNVGVLYTSLMLIKVILTEKNVSHSWKKFEDFLSSIKEQFNFKKVPSHITSIVEEIETVVKKKGKSRTYYDLSSDNKNLNEFDKALVDLADPLLPVRAHGIMSLTKLVETLHPEVAAKEDFLLCLFQKNLDHEDSFIYLAAVNGICALSSTFPDKVIEILVHEFVGLTQQTKNQDVSPKTRAKIGEILVKTTRALGEMIPKYKNLLVNAFLCGTRDPDPLVRASSLSCLGEFCKMMGFRLGNLIVEILYCIGCIIQTDKDDSCRRAGVLVATELLRGLGKDALTELGENLLTLYRSLKQLRDNDKDPVLQLHAQLALEEFDDIVQQFLFAKPKLEKTIFLAPN